MTAIDKSSGFLALVVFRPPPPPTSCNTVMTFCNKTITVLPNRAHRLNKSKKRKTDVVFPFTWMHESTTYSPHFFARKARKTRKATARQGPGARGGDRPLPLPAAVSPSLSAFPVRRRGFVPVAMQQESSQHAGFPGERPRQTRQPHGAHPPARTGSGRGWAGPGAAAATPRPSATPPAPHRAGPARRLCSRQPAPDRRRKALSRGARRPARPTSPAEPTTAAPAAPRAAEAQAAGGPLRSPGTGETADTAAAATATGRRGPALGRGRPAPAPAPPNGAQRERAGQAAAPPAPGSPLPQAEGPRRGRGKRSAAPPSLPPCLPAYLPRPAAQPLPAPKARGSAAPRKAEPASRARYSGGDTDDDNGSASPAPPSAAPPPPPPLPRAPPAAGRPQARPMGGLARLAGALAGRAFPLARYPCFGNRHFWLVAAGKRFAADWLAAWRTPPPPLLFPCSWLQSGARL